MTVVDVIVLVVAAVATARGWRRGLLGQAFEFGGGLVGLLAGVLLAPRLTSVVTDGAGLPGAVVALLIILVGLSFGQVIGFAIGQRSGALARRARLGEVDAALGSVFGIGVTLVSFWLLGSLLVHGPVRGLAGALERSKVLRAMNSMAAPPDVLASVRGYLDSSGFPQVFVNFPRTSAPVDLPDGNVARRATRVAARSTVQVSVDACGGRQLGSGWISAPTTVVTNAHVVAGGGPVGVTTRDGMLHSAVVVLFDPAEDVAVLRVEGVEGPVLDVERRSLDRGATGATLGYPGGGGLTVQRAAVTDRLSPTGYDIYSRHTVRREVYELRANIRQGDSGGPFVLPGGSVAGVVFAASTTNRSTGYALTIAQVSDELARGRSATRPVDTGRCTH